MVSSASRRALAAAVSLVTVGAGLAAAAGPAAAVTSSPLAELRSRAGGAAHTTVEARGASHFFGVKPGHAAGRPTDVSATAAPDSAARGWLRHYGSVFGVRDQAHDLRTARVTTDRAGSRVVKFTQTVGGVPVAGGGVIVAMDSSNRLLSVDARVSSLATVAPTTSVSAATARRTAVARVRRTNPHERLAATAPTLEVFDQSVLGGPVVTGPSLVWVATVTSADHLVRHTVFVDAQRGGVTLDLDANPHAAEVVCTGGTGLTPASDPSCAADGPNAVVATSDPTPPNPGPPANPGQSGYDDDVYNAYRFAGAVDTFYSTLFGRNSLDDKGMSLNSTVHFCADEGQGTSCPMDNAFWDGQEMVYGNGFASALDVVGHEMTHGVTEHMSNLFDYYQSGAINESMSDVMGELIQQVEGPVLDGGNHSVYDPASDWEVGEKLPGGVPVRYMNDPTRDCTPDHLDSNGNPAGCAHDPDSMTSPYYSAYLIDSPLWDVGGVHANDGVDNKAAYLMTVGGTFNGFTVPGMTTQAADAAGVTDPTALARLQQVERDVKTANVYYELQSLMNSSTDYYELSSLLPQACNLLDKKPLPLPAPFDSATTTLTAADCASVAAAVSATRMSTRPSAAGAAVRPAGTACTSPTLVRLDRFDTSATAPSNVGYARGHGSASFGQWWWSLSKDTDYSPAVAPPVYAYSGTGAMWGDDADPGDSTSPATREDAWIASPPIAAHSGTFVNFATAWEFDYDSLGNYDGGRVEYTVDGGKTWTDAAGLFTGGGYNGVVTNLDSPADDYVDPNPLKGHRAFVGSSHGWTASRLDLSSLTGKSVQLRWRIGTDDSLGSLGWYVDDVQTYTCISTAVSLAGPTSLVYGHAGTLTAHLTRTGTTAALAGLPVALYQRPHGATTWSGPVQTHTTGSTGNAAFTVKPAVGYDYAARFLAPAMPTYVASNLAARTVAVTYAVTATPGVTHIARGHRFSVTGGVAPNAHGSTVALQRYYSGGWHTVASAPLSSTSRYSVSYLPTVSGTLHFRVAKYGAHGVSSGVAPFNLAVS